MAAVMMQGWLNTAQQASLPVAALALLLLAAVQAIKAWPRLRELQIGGDASLRTDLMKRVRELEERVKELEKTIGRNEAEHAAREQFLRHELAGETSVLDAALVLLKVNPDRVVEVIDEVTSMRAANRERLAKEKGAAVGAVVAVAGGKI